MRYRLLAPTTLMGLLALSTAAQAQSAWNQLGAVRQDGSRVSTAYADDDATGVRLTLGCDRKQLVASTSPVPLGAKDFVEVTIAIGDWRRVGRWKVSGIRLIAYNEISARLRDALLGSGDEIRLQVSGGSRATFSAQGAKDVVEIALEDCPQG